MHTGKLRTDWQMEIEATVLMGGWIGAFATAVAIF